MKEPKGNNGEPETLNVTGPTYIRDSRPSSRRNVKKSINVLIADEHDILREALRTKLIKARLNVCAEARTGNECITLAQLNQPDVVVMDFAMPVLNGIEATRVIRSTLPATEVLFLTGYYTEQLVLEAFTAGARGFLMKTNAREHLVPAVLSLARHKPYLMKPALPLFQETGEAPHKTTEETSAPVVNLTTREREIVRHIASGSSSKEVATELNISTRTVEAHRSNIFQKLDLRSVSELVLYAVRNQIIYPYSLEKNTNHSWLGRGGQHHGCPDYPALPFSRESISRAMAGLS